MYINCNLLFLLKTTKQQTSKQKAQLLLKKNKALSTYR